MKRPAFQFYPADWRNNANLRRCSWAARGVWIEVMGLTHDSDEYGILHWTLKEIAQALGCPVALVKELASKGVLKGCDNGSCEALIYIPRSGRQDGDPVTLIPVQPGPIWFSSRMVKDEYVRTVRGQQTRYGDEPDESPKHSPKHSPKPPKSESLKITPTHRQSDGSTSSSSVNPHSIEPPSTTKGIEVVDKDSAAARVAEILTQIASWEAQRGKESKIYTSSKYLRAWITAGLTDVQLREAYELAVSDRVRQNDATAVNAGFLDAFVGKLLNPTGGESAVSAVAKAWHETASGIESKGRELNIPEPSASTGGFPAYKARVFAAAGLHVEAA